MNTKFILVLISLVFFEVNALYSQDLVTQKKVLQLMGCRFEVTAVAENETLAWQAINAGIAEMERIEKLISSWDKNSQTSAINRNAGVKPVNVDKELFDLIFRAKKVSELTNGAFDISFASMDRIWKFDGSMKSMPAQDDIEDAKQFINWENILLDKANQTVFLKEKGMKIGFGAIGKGYAANRAKELMKQTEGVRGGLVNASGDLISWGKSMETEGWTIKLADPKIRDKALGWIAIQDMAVVTSGDYERFVEFDGKRYAHIIDPRTGYPTTGIKSVTIICLDAEVADALATSVFVLGKDDGMKLINSLKSIEGLIVTDDNQTISSNHLQLNYF